MLWFFSIMDTGVFKNDDSKYCSDCLHVSGGRVRVGSPGAIGDAG